MSGLPDVWLLVFLASACTAGVIAILVRSLRCAMHSPASDARWPWFIRWFWFPARALGPWIARWTSAAMMQRTRRQLEAADLHPGLEPQEWIALRVVHALLSATATGAACIYASLPGWLVPAGAWTGYLAGGLWVRRVVMDSERRIVRDLPPYLDLLTVCVEAGATLTSAVRLIVEQAPPSPLRNYFDRVLREVRGGRTRSQAFSAVAESYGVESLCVLASALAHAESAGMSLGQVLRSQSEQRSTERFLRAERLAMEAPVKMLAPLIFCIFPCTFIVLAVPIAHRLMEVFAK